MKITFIANACAIYESDSFRLLSDPWLIDGAFDGAWFHYPKVKTTPGDLRDVDAIYISHLHPDHYCKLSLSSFPRDIPIVYLKHGKNYLHNMLKRDGWKNLIAIGDGETKAVGPFNITMYSPWCLNPWADSSLGNLIDSCMVLEADGHKILNTNDCTPTLAGCVDLREKHGQFDIAQIQFNAAGPYPSCFNGLGWRESEKVKERNLKYMVLMALVLRPKLVHPFAGAYIIGGKNWHKNKTLGTTTAQDAARYLIDRDIDPLHLLEGESYDLSSKYKVPDVKPSSRDEMMAYASTLKDRRYSYEEMGQDLPNFDALFDKSRKSFADICAMNLIDCRVDINGRIAYKPIWDTRNHLRASIDERLLYMIMNFNAHWNNAEIGCHVEFDRTGKYIPDVHTLLSFLHVKTFGQNIIENICP